MNNKKTAFLASAFVIALATKPALADDHDHKKDKKPHAKQTEASKKKKKGHDHKQEHKEGEKHEHKEGEKDNHEDGEHKEEDGHDHKKEGAKNEQGHGEEEEGAKNIGPEKGITAFDEEAGFTLSKEALKTFSVETASLNGSGPWTVPASALLLTGEEKSIYRVRDGAFKRIDIAVVSKNKNQAVIQSDELGSGDQVVTKGVGNVRIAEVDATSGESGHHH
jgi:hypothetical protein